MSKVDTADVLALLAQWLEAETSAAHTFSFRQARETRAALIDLNAAHVRRLAHQAQESAASAERQLHAVYAERAQLVAALSKLFPASLEEDEKAPGWPVCIIDLPTGQVSWHVTAADAAMFFGHLPAHAGRVWDGHSTPEKYARLAALSTQQETTMTDVATNAQKILGTLGTRHALILNGTNEGLTGTINDDATISLPDGQRLPLNVDAGHDGGELFLMAAEGDA